jgi:hypothetical protein
VAQLSVVSGGGCAPFTKPLGFEQLEQDACRVSVAKYQKPGSVALT